MKSKSPILDGAMQRMKADHCLPTTTILNAEAFKAECERLGYPAEITTPADITASPKAANVQPLKPELDDEPTQHAWSLAAVYPLCSGQWPVYGHCTLHC